MKIVSLLSLQPQYLILFFTKLQVMHAAYTKLWESDILRETAYFLILSNFLFQLRLFFPLHPRKNFALFSQTYDFHILSAMQQKE